MASSKNGKFKKHGFPQYLSKYSMNILNCIITQTG